MNPHIRLVAIKNYITSFLDDITSFLAVLCFCVVTGKLLFASIHAYMDHHQYSIISVQYGSIHVSSMRFGSGGSSI